MLEDFPHGIDGGFAVCADDGVRRMVVVPDGTAFAQELGLERQSEFDTRSLAAGTLQDGLDDLFESSWLHRRAHHHGVKFPLGRECRADLLRQALDGAQVLAAVRRGRRAHTNESDFGLLHRTHRVLGHRDAAGIDHIAHQLLDAFFEDGRFARADQLQLGGVDVDPDHPVAIARQAGHGHRAHVTQAEDADTFRSRRLAQTTISQGTVPKGDCPYLFTRNLHNVVDDLW